jgi:threonine dehydratase
MISTIQALDNLIIAQNRIKNYIIQTPILESEVLNSNLGHQFYFKVDALQKTGAFKIRAVFNHLLALKESNNMPSKVVGYSTGNHGIGLAYACKQLGISCRIYLPESTAYLKAQIATMHGAEVIYTKTRLEAETKARIDGGNDFYFLHPSDSDLSIAGSGTMCLEALNQLSFKPDAIFASCGGGGLLSGSYLAKELASPSSLLFGAEPENANDAFLSLQNNKLYAFDTTPETVADGLIALKLSARTFEHIKKLDGLFLVSEERIKYWTIWLSYLLKITVEPSCAISMESATQWLKNNSAKLRSQQKILILISGGNIDHNFYSNLWKETHYLNAPPTT